MGNRKSRNDFDEEKIAGISPQEVDQFLNFPVGTFDHIPHYARVEALSALNQVREMEANNVFRPGLYYIVLSDLCSATRASLTLGNELSRKRVETFILTCVDALGHIDATNYFLFLREIGDATLILFSSFEDAYNWWITMNSWLKGREQMWNGELSKQEQKEFQMKAKTIIHAGEISYSGINIPLSAAVNQIFKVEKSFKPYEIGITHQALACARPVFRPRHLRPIFRSEICLPGESENTRIYRLDDYRHYLKRSQK